MALGLVWFGDAIRKKVVDEVSKRMEQSGAQAVSYAKELVPIDTGQLQASISYFWSRETMTLTLVADRPYAVMVEVGTRRMAARPYLRPAMMMVGKVFGTSTEVQFSNVANKYQAGYKKQISGLNRPKVIIGHRRQRRGA